MLFEIGCRYVILGHSERRHGLGEDDAMIAKKIVASFQHGLLPILCVGETLRERESNQTNTIVKNQVQKALSPLSSSQIESVTIAYEPVWAIGTGKAATPAMAQEVHQMIRQTLEQEYGKSIAHNVRIQYGGSVTAENIHELISQPDIDGALVGGASLKLDSFFKIVQVSAQVKG
jgi:triosephosphate isomerase